MYTVITENDISNWDDQTGLKYHFPSRYLKFLTPGTKVVYYKGRMTDKKFESKRLSRDPHYFGIGEIGKIEKEDQKNNYYAEILNFKIFEKAVPFKINNETIEQIPKSRLTNYWRDGVREINAKVFNKILSYTSVNKEDQIFNDQSETEFSSTTTEGEKKYAYSSRYERKKETRDKALHIHGYTCQACGFNFKETYGEWGSGYIHVHHLKPLHTNMSEVEINPKTDLCVVCANCHSMIHRRRDKTLTLEEIKKIIKK
jgi:5-methylcytosine-specific restriction protein A